MVTEHSQSNSPIGEEPVPAVSVLGDQVIQGLPGPLFVRRRRTRMSVEGGRLVDRRVRVATTERGRYLDRPGESPAATSRGWRGHGRSAACWSPRTAPRT